MAEEAARYAARNEIRRLEELMQRIYRDLQEVTTGRQYLQAAAREEGANNGGFEWFAQQDARLRTRQMMLRAAYSHHSAQLNALQQQ